jgi:hypothetical protein
MANCKTIARSNSLHIFDPRIPSEHPLLDLVQILAFEVVKYTTDLLAPQLGLHGIAGVLVYEIVPYTHGDLGLRRPRGSEESGLGGRAQQCRGAQDSAGLWVPHCAAARGCGRRGEMDYGTGSALACGTRGRRCRQ